MKKITYVSLGEACRPAAQIKKNIGDSLSFPFDWTVTPFHSLIKIFSNDFKEDKVLSNEHIEITSNGAIKWSYSGLFFRHGLNSKDCTKWLNTPLSKYTHTMPEEFYTSQELLDVKNSFLHTFNRLKCLENLNNTVIFIRWLGLGRNTNPTQKKLSHSGVPDGCLDEENFFNLYNLINKKYPNLNFILFIVITLRKRLKSKILDKFIYNNLGGSIY